MNRLIAVLALGVLIQPCLAEECEKLPGKVEQYIKAFEKEVRGSEYCRFRDIARGDIDSDGEEDLVVVFNVEGACHQAKGSASGTCGNHHETYVKAYLGNNLNEVPTLEIGGRGIRFFTNVKVRKGAIEFDTLAYGKEDAMCCPSIKGKTQFEIRDGKFIERK